MNYGMNQMWPTPVLKGKMNNKKLIDDVINHILLKYGHSNKISSDILGIFSNLLIIRPANVFALSILK